MRGGEPSGRWRPLVLFAGVWLAALAAPVGAAASGGSLRIVTSGLPGGQRPSILLAGPGVRRAVRSDSVVLHGLRAGRYLVTVAKVVIGRSSRGVHAGAVAYPARNRVALVVRRGQTATVGVSYGTVVNPRVRALPRILGVVGEPGDPAGILLPGGRRPAVGTIFTSGPTAALPAGLVSRVTGSKRQGTDVLVSLAAVPVSEAVPSLSFVGSLLLAPAGGGGQQSGSEVPAQAASLHSAHKANACGLSAAASLLKFGAHLDSFEVRQAFVGAWPPQFKLTVAVRTKETLGVGEVAAGINCDWDLAEIGPFEGAIPAGPIVVPVYATLPVKAGLHVNGTLQLGSFNVASTTVAHVAAGVDERAASLSEQGSNVWVTATPSVSGSAELFATIGIQAGIGIAKVANVHVEAGFGPHLTWSSGQGCNLDMALGSLSAGTEVLDQSLDTPAYTPFTLHLWSGCQPSPPPPPPPPPLPPPKPKVPAAGPTLIYDGHTAGNAFDSDTSFSDWANATGQEASVQETLPSELESYRCVALLLNESIETTQAEQLQRYLNEGGTVVVIGEHEGGQWSTADFALDEFLSFIHAGLSIDDNSTDEGPHVTFHIESSPLTSGVTDVGYNWASTVSVSGTASPLIENAEGSGTLVGSQTIGSGTLIVTGDSNMLSDNSEEHYANDGNGQFVRNICP
jgi:hypothetical protein